MYTVHDGVLYVNGQPVPNPTLISDAKLDVAVGAGELEPLKAWLSPLAMSLSLMNPDGETNLYITEFNNFNAPVEAVAAFLNGLEDDNSGVIAKIAAFATKYANCSSDNS